VRTACQRSRPLRETVIGMRYVKKKSALPAVPKAAPAASQAVHNATKGQ
jgi:hypothetical protein